MRDKVFISYSNRDGDWIEKLDVFLKPWQQRGQLSTWTDRELSVGEDWDLAIGQALAESAVAMLVISQRFLASDYIRERELPILLAAHERGELGLACLYLSPSNVDQLDFSFERDEGETRTIRLTSLQGLNNPDEPITKRRGARREALLSDASARLAALYQDRMHMSPPDLDERVLAERPVLDLRLRLGDGKLTRLFQTEDDWRLETRSDYNLAPEDLDAPERRGSVLFELLFGPGEKALHAVMQHLGGSRDGAIPQPPRFPVRLRIRTSDAELAALSWPLTTWGGALLCKVGWSFELLHPELRPRDLRDQLFRAPCPIMALIDPAAGGGSDHLRAIQERLDQAWPVYPDRLIVPDGLDAAIEVWDARRPVVLYLLDRTTTDGHGLAGLGGRISGLRDLWGERPPQIVFLNLLGPPSPAVADELLTLSKDPVLLVAQYGDAADPYQARQAALAWLARLLTEPGPQHPVSLLQREALPRTTAFTAFRDWTTETSAEPPREKLAHLLLDRVAQRSQVHKSLSELVHKPDRRMFCFIAAGTSGNLVELFADQLLDWFRRYAPELALIRRLRLRLPEDKADFDFDALEVQVRRDLRIGADASLCAAIAAHQPRAPGRARPVLLIDWGVRGGTGEPLPNAASLAAWVELNGRHLAATLDCSAAGDLRLLSCLTLEVPKTEHSALQESVRGLRHSVRYRAFRLSLLPELDRVEREDLSDFLDDSDNATIPEDLLDDMPDLLIRRSDGRFDETVALIEQAERSSWYELHEQLLAWSTATAEDTDE